jgi:redox-sensing transcriptional repressor
MSLKEEEMDKHQIPDIVVGRLPLYLRTLQQMALEGRQVTSSQELGERLGISAAQIRKDLSQFGEFGKQGTGYNIEYLVSQVSHILHLEKLWDMVVIGAGDVGHAVARYQGFKNRGFRVVMVFDNDPGKIGMKIGEYVVQDMADMAELVKKSNIQIAMLAVPVTQAQAVTNLLVEAGVRAILNYAPINLTVPAGVLTQYFDPAIHLQRMSYYLE